jgi:hypothetical protein
VTVSATRAFEQGRAIVRLREPSPDDATLASDLARGGWGNSPRACGPGSRIFRFAKFRDDRWAISP